MANQRGGRTRREPQRTCVACRQQYDKRVITRIVRGDTGVVVDRSGKLNGRGAYLCDSPACWDKALSSNLLNQALRTVVSASEKEAIGAQKPGE